MTTLIENPVEVEIPEWIHDMKFCHVVEDDNTLRAFCGDDFQKANNICGGLYDAANPLAICDYCGAPTCPRCAQLVDLKYRLEK